MFSLFAGEEGGGDKRAEGTAAEEFLQKTLFYLAGRLKKTWEAAAEIFLRPLQVGRKESAADIFMRKHCDKGEQGFTTRIVSEPPFCLRLVFALHF